MRDLHRFIKEGGRQVQCRPHGPGSICIDCYVHAYIICIALRAIKTRSVGPKAPDVDSVTHVKRKGLRTGEFRYVTVTGGKGYELEAGA